MLSSWILLIPLGVSLLVPLVAIIELNSHLDKKILCTKCKIVSRKGIVELYNIDKDVKKCPHCEEATVLRESSDGYKYEYIDDLPTPFAPSISWIKRQKIAKTLTNHKHSSKVDIQVQSYLKLQQQKLEKMKGDIK